MFNTLPLLLCVFLTLLADSKCENCDKLGTLLYEDLNCRPQTAPGKSCPTHYECDKFEKSNTTCFLREHKIPLGETVGGDLVTNCRVACHCDSHGDVADITCAHFDCPFNSRSTECYSTYTLEDCCSSGKKCPPFDDVAKCTINSSEYKEGQLIAPGDLDRCLDCVCQKGFKGQLVEPFCKRSLCSAQIGNADKLVRKCAPVFPRKDIFCCPIGWLCPSKSLTLKRVSPKSSLDSKLRCKWGDETFKIGETLIASYVDYGLKKEATCECRLPPLLACTEEFFYNN